MENEQVEVHHVGGRLHGRLAVKVPHSVHRRLTQAQASHAHLLRRPDLPVGIAVAVAVLDIAALLEAVARELRRLAHSLLGSYAMTRAGRVLLAHPNTDKRRAP
jgi:hypothetical protein